MTAVGIGFDPALNLGIPSAVAGAQGASSAGAFESAAAGASADAAHGSPASFHRILHAAGQRAAHAGSATDTRNGKTPSEAGRSESATGQKLSFEWAPPPARMTAGGEPAWDGLAQLIQNLIASNGRLSETAAVAPPEQGPDDDPGDEGEGFLRFIELLKQLQTTCGASPSEAGDTLTLHSDEADGRSGSGLSGLLKQLQQQLQLRASEGASPAGPGEIPSQPGEMLTRIPAEGIAAWNGAGLGDLLQELRMPETLAPAEAGRIPARLQDVLTRAPAAPDDGEAGEGTMRFVALLKQLRTPDGSTPAERGEMAAQLRDMLNQSGGEGQPAGGLPGRLHHLLATLIAGQGAAAEDSAATRPAESGQARTEDMPLKDTRPDLPGVLREVLGRGKPEAAGRGETAARPEESRPASSERGPVPAAEASRPMAALSAAGREHQGLDGTPSSSARQAVRAQELPPAAEAERSSAPQTSAASAIAVEDASDEGVSAAFLRDARTAPAAESATDTSGRAGAASKLSEADGAAAKGHVVEQIVQRAVLHLKSDQGEARIDLKPEFLGHVRMQIVTENQQVTVRIMTELPMVRDLIEQNLPQLKSDLQQQGLQVERVEVSVADDPRRDAGRQGRAAGRRNGRGPSAPGIAAVEPGEQRAQELASYWAQGGRGTINMFV